MAASVSLHILVLLHEGEPKGTVLVIGLLLFSLTVKDGELLAIVFQTENLNVDFIKEVLDGTHLHLSPIANVQEMKNRAHLRAEENLTAAPQLLR